MGGPPWLFISIAVISLVGVVLTALIGPIVADRMRLGGAVAEVRNALEVDPVRAVDDVIDAGGVQSPKDYVKNLEFVRLRYQIELDERRSKLVREYAAQGLVQSRISFLTSLRASVAGFVVILIGVILAIAGVAPSRALIPVASGTIIEAASLLFVGQDRRNQQRMFEFFERLREDRKLDESLELLRIITDDRIRSRMQAILALHFGGIEDKLPLFETIISDPSTSRRSGEVSPSA